MSVAKFHVTHKKIKQNNMKYNFLKLQNATVGLICLSFVFASCNGGGNTTTSSDSTNTSNSSASTDNNTILGAGSTFIYPFFSKAFAVYNQQTGVKVNYQSIGSGGGILQLTNKT